ncbi:MAG: hypothetical protein AB7T20_10040 [Steroidobacteraceae bacterium]
MTRTRFAWLMAATIWIGGAAADTAEEADAAVLALLNSYEVGSTTYLTFSQDFDLSREAITQSLFGERQPPTSGRIGIIELKDRTSNLTISGPNSGNLVAEIMASGDSGKVSPEINQYMQGTFLFGYLKDPAEKTMYIMTPESYIVVARLRFLSGILSEKVIFTESGGQP